MGDILQKALSWLGDLLWSAFEQVALFFLQFFPDADPAVKSAIDGFGAAMAGGDVTFNVFYFVDMQAVALFFSMVVVTVLGLLVYAMVKIAISLVHRVMDMIPVIG